MKKFFSLSLLTLFLMFFMLISIGGVGVSAYTYNPDDSGLDFTPYKDDIVFCRVDLQADMGLGPWPYAARNPIAWNGGQEVRVAVYIRDLEPGEVAFQFNLNTDFSPLLESQIRSRYKGPLYYTGGFIKSEYGLEGMYWNPWLQWWQLEYPVEPEEVDGNAVDWFNHISQFDYGIARSEIFFNGSVFGLLIVEEPSGELAGCKFEYDYYSDEDWIYFKPNLRYLKTLIMDGEFVDGEDILESLEQNFGQDFDGYLYWNFEEQYWQIDYYNKSEFNNKEVDMVTDLLDTLAEIGAGIGDLFGRIVESVGQFFYTPGTGDNPGSFTIVGILTIAAVVVSLSMWVLRLILRLFKLRG